MTNVIIHQSAAFGYSRGRFNFGDSWRNLDDSEITRRLEAYQTLGDGADSPTLQGYARAAAASIRSELERRRGEWTVAS